MDVNTIRVLVVDDDEGMRFGVIRALQPLTLSLPDVVSEVAFHIEAAASGKEALEKWDSFAPQLVFLDFKLPDMTGFDLLEHWSPLPPDRLLVMMTAYASIETAVRATRHGAFEFLAKPFTPHALRKTAEKAAEQVIFRIQAKKLSEEKRQVRFQFISVLSHELKSPLAAIESYLHIMKNRTAGERLDAYDNMVDRSIFRIGHMRKLIFDLLDLTRIESGQKARHFQDVDLALLSRHVIEAVEADAKKRQIAIHLRHVPERSFYADPEELEMILNNLVSNAVKYNLDEGTVDIALSLEEQALRITVKDTGIGMTPEEKQKLFHDFVRIRNEKTKDILGSGLGLSTVKKLAQLYQGEIQVESQPDVGSEFTVWLPSPR